MSAFRLLALLGIAAASAAGLYLAFAATGTSMTCSPGHECVTHHTGLFRDHGLAGVIPPLLPALIPAGVLAVNELQLPEVLAWLLAGVFLAGCAAAVFSVGFFYLPAALFTLAAAASAR